MISSMLSILTLEEKQSEMMMKTFVVLAALSLTLAEATRTPPPTPKEDLDALVRLTSDWGGKPFSWTNSTPACQWAGVICDPYYGFVTEMRWGNAGVYGHLNLTNLPKLVQTLYLFKNSFPYAPPVLSNLPAVLSYVDLSYNGMTGNPNLSDLPVHVQSFDLSGNGFCGSSKLNIPCDNIDVEGKCNDVTHTVTFYNTCT